MRNQTRAVFVIIKKNLKTNDDMKVLLFIGGCILVFYLIFKAPDWADSDSNIKQNIGCTVMALMILLMVLLNVVGACKSCGHSSGPSYDYYDAPRK